MRTPRNRSSIGDSLGLLSMLALATFVIAMLSLAREILMPIALASLLTFLLAPAVTRLEHWIGRVLAVCVVVTMIFVATAGAGWMLTRQLIDLAAKLPDYRGNILTKVHSIQPPKGLRAFSRVVEEVQRELPGAAPASESPVVELPTGTKTGVAVPPNVARVEVVAKPASNPMDLIRSLLGPLMGPLGTGALVLLLVVFMLLQKDDLRRRVIRLLGQGHISATTAALDDAGQRVSRYLLMQLIVNISYGVPVAIGLWFIGVPNAFLWGGLATVLRFVPYIGPWIAAAFPVLLSLAVSPGWTVPLMTIGLFIVLELISNNIMEPLLYGTSTGVSPIAIIVAAVVWTWLWGPVGLMLSTPLTVCLVVLGRHVPRLEFLSVLLSDEEALTPAEDCYQRMLSPGEHDEMDLVESFLATGSLAELYDEVLLPVVMAAECDRREGAIDGEQLAAIHQSLRDILQDLTHRREESWKMEPEGREAPPAQKGCRVLCLPARAERDELAGMMLSHVLESRGCACWTVNAPVQTSGEEFLQLVAKSELEAVVISVVAPSAVLHARYLCLRLRAKFPELRIVVCLWGMEERSAAAGKRLREAGASAVEFSLLDAVDQVVPPERGDRHNDKTTERKLTPLRASMSA